MTFNQVTLFVTFHVKPFCVEDFKAAHRLVWSACAAEPECLLFDVFHDPEQPGRFRFIGVWNASREWFETKQLNKPYYTIFWGEVEADVGKEVEIECMEHEVYLDGGRRMK